MEGTDHDRDQAKQEKPYWGDKHRPFVKIGTDADELRDLADAIVRGASIAHAEIADLRALIEAVQAHPDVRLAETDDEGKPTIDDPTMLTIHGGEVWRCECRMLHIGVSLAASTAFSGDVYFLWATFSAEASFWEATFSGYVNFMDATFSGDVDFWTATFSDNASFGKATFSGVAIFGPATFSGDADFWGATFSGNASFGKATFSGCAGFMKATFCSDASFRWATFSGDAAFWGASISGDADFSIATFSGPAALREATFSGRADFVETTFSVLTGSVRGELNLEGVDARTTELRTFQVHRPAFRLSERPHFIRHLILKFRAWATTRIPDWTTVRGIGQLAILTRVSVLALVLVPVLAATWPAVRVAINRYNDAVGEAGEALDASADRLDTIFQQEEAGEGDADGDDSTIREVATDLQDAAERWRDRFGDMTLDEHDFPNSLALAFFAAVFITLGQLVYQTRSPARIRKEDEDGFVEWMHTRYPEGAEDRDDGLRRACDSLELIATKRLDYHRNLVRHHGETVWIPSRNAIHLFNDPDETETAAEEESGATPDADDDAKTPEVGEPSPKTSREGILSGAERARITLEEGARAEYWLKGREQFGWSLLSFILYALGVLALLAILIIQGNRIGNEAGWWGGDQVEQTAQAPGA